MKDTDNVSGQSQGANPADTIFRQALTTVVVIQGVKDAAHEFANGFMEGFTETISYGDYAAPKPESGAQRLGQITGDLAGAALGVGEMFLGGSMTAIDVSATGGVALVATGGASMAVATSGAAHAVVGLKGAVSKALSGGSTDGGEPNSGGKPEGASWITPESLSDEEGRAVMETLTHIDAGTTPDGPISVKWGTPFGNREGYLPKGNYVEYRVAPSPDIEGAGTRRIVRNLNTGELYYTWTHYGTAGQPAFVRIR